MAPITIRDNRAATFTKLGNLDAALNDGRKMIQQEGNSCTVWLSRLKCWISVHLIFLGVPPCWENFAASRKTGTGHEDLPAWP